VEDVVVVLLQEALRNNPEHHVMIDAIVVAIPLLQDGFVGLQLFDGISLRSLPTTITTV
jgi:hypothetical protein